MDDAAGGQRVDDPTFVPAEQRVWGLDRRTFPLAGAVIALFVVMVVVLPRVDAAVDVGDVTTDGEVLVLAGADELTMRAAGDWQLDGFRQSDGEPVKLPSTTTLWKGGVQMEVRVAGFDGTASELIDRVEDLNDRKGDPLGLGAVRHRLESTVRDGNPAVVKVYTGFERKGVVIAFVQTTDGGRDLGVEVSAFGDSDDMAERLPEVLTMVDSIGVPPPADPSDTGAGS